MSRIKSHKVYSNRDRIDYAALALKSIGLTSSGMQIEFFSHADSGERDRVVSIWLDTDAAAQLIKRVRLGEKQGHCAALYRRADELKAENESMNIRPLLNINETEPTTTGK